MIFCQVYCVRICLKMFHRCQKTKWWNDKIKKNVYYGFERSVYWHIYIEQSNNQYFNIFCRCSDCVSWTTMVLLNLMTGIDCCCFVDLLFWHFLYLFSPICSSVSSLSWCRYYVSLLSLLPAPQKEGIPAHLTNIPRSHRTERHVHYVSYL